MHWRGDLRPVIHLRGSGSSLILVQLAHICQATKTGGKSVLVGMGTPNHLLPLSDAGAREIDIISVWRYANCYPRAIEIMQRSQVDGVVPKISQIITHRFDGLTNVPAALQRACTSQDQAGGIVIKVAVGTDVDSQ